MRYLGRDRRGQETSVREIIPCSALILAPRGRDAAIAAALLQEIETPATVCASLDELRLHVNDTAAFAVMTEEAIASADLEPLVTLLRAQPPWSDLPFIIMTRHGGGPERNPSARRYSELLGNVTFLERPFHRVTFLSVARTALRSRHRQYEARERLRELREREDRLRRLNETLEERVVARTKELEAAHAAVLAEIAQREQAEAQLRQKQKMETLGQLTGGVAHDFNNLLMAVLGNLELLSKHTRDDPKLARLVGNAIEGGRRGTSLTQRLLAFAHQQALQVAACSLTDLLRGIRPLIEQSIGPEIDLDIDMPATLPLVSLDANQIELAILNLVVNARDAMPDGGHLSIRLDVAHTGAEDDLIAGDYARVVITDTGHGMDAETLQRATEPFFSTKGIGRGTGLGLSMVHGLVSQLGGTLRLTSEPGRGTRVELWLPTTTDADADTTTPIEIPAPSSSPAVRATILLVDDDALVASSTAALLEDLGHQVIVAHSGDSALSILRQKRSIDLLITDYAMPQMNGVQLANAAREIRPGLPILLASGFAELPNSLDGDVSRINKPFRQDLLSEQVGRLVQSGEYRV